MADLPEPLDVIAVGAHPDDVEIGCGGTLALLAAQGFRVGIVDLTDGEPTPRSSGPEERLREAAAAAQTLGVAPARCIVVEDSVSGLNAARAAGMKTIAFVGASHIPDNYADALRAMGITRIMRKMDELPSLVEAGMRGEFGDVQS